MATLYSASISAASPPEIYLHTGNEGIVSARSLSGALQWRATLPAREDETSTRWFKSADGKLVVESGAQAYVLSDTGQLLASRSSPEPHEIGQYSQDAGRWEETIATAASGSIRGQPAVDSTGSVWAVSIAFSRLQILRSSIENDWAVDLDYDLTAVGGSFGDAAIVVDAFDRVFVAFRELTDKRRIRVLSYQSESGWSEPLTIFSEQNPDFIFQDLSAAVDADGNVVVASMLEGAVGNRVFAIVFDAATRRWGQPTFLSSQSQPNVGLPTVVGNRARTAVELIYWVRSGSARGLYVRTFLSPEQGWTQPVRVSGSARAFIPQAGAFASYPAVLDDEGNLTLPYYVRIRQGNSTTWVMRMSRREDGVWTRPQTALIHEDFEALFAELGDTDYSATGDIFMTFKQAGPGLAPTELWALRYDSEQRLWTSEILYQLDGDAEQRVRVAFLNEETAITTYLDSRLFEYRSRTFDGSEWAPDIGLPGRPLGTVHETVASGGDVAFVGDRVEPVDEVFGTWYRNE